MDRHGQVQLSHAYSKWVKFIYVAKLPDIQETSDNRLSWVGDMEQSWNSLELFFAKSMKLIAMHFELYVDLLTKLTLKVIGYRESIADLRQSDPHQGYIFFRKY